MTALGEAAARASTGPGVYVFLGADRTLLYVGKANNIRARLRGHAKNQPGGGRRLETLYAAVSEVAWETTPSEEAALLREADLIVALRPVFNASMTTDDGGHYVAVDGSTFRLTTDRGYGCFPHLAKGIASHPAKICKGGFTALLRMLWASQDGERAWRPPRSISGVAPPPVHESPFAASLGRSVHAFLSGASPRLVGEITTMVTPPPVARPGLERDAAAALAFFATGPRHLRDLRRRHHLPAGPVPVGVFAEALAAELRESIGDFRPGRVHVPSKVVGRRRARELELIQQLRSH